MRMSDIEISQRIEGAEQEKTEAEDAENWPLSYALEEKIERLVDIAKSRGMNGY